jgi:hypothetical protein
MNFRLFGEQFARRLGNAFGSGGANTIPYRLLDTYDTDRAAGAVNGTLAEPTGQVRTVTDGNSRLSTTGGKLTVVAGGAGAGNPGLWYPQMTRLAGLVLMADINISVNGMEFGWDTAQGGNLAFCLRPTAVGFAVRDNNTAIIVEVAAAVSTPYKGAVVLRATGAWYFVKGGIYTNWTPLWISAISSGNLFPGITEIAASDAFIVDNTRSPVTLYIPAPLVYDTFQRANGALGSTVVTGPDSQVLAALAWLFTAGIWAVASNVAVATPVLGADVIVNGAFAADTDWTKGAGWAIALGTANATASDGDLTNTPAPLVVGRWYQTAYTVSAFSAGTIKAGLGNNSFPTHAANGTYTESGRALTTGFLMRGAGFTGSIDNVSARLLTTAELFASIQASVADVIADVGVTLSAALNGLQSGLVLNLDSDSNPQNFILAYLDGRGNVVLEECVAGVYTTKFTTAITYSAGAVLRVKRRGTNCWVFYNGVAVNTVQTMTANLNTRHGLFSTSPSNSLDNFTIWPMGTENQYAALDGF